MAGHHRGGGQAVGQPRCELIAAVAAGRVAHQIDLVRIDPGEQHAVLDQAVEEIVDVAFVPQVPGVGRSPGGDVEAFRGLIEADLVLPLRVVDLGGRATAAVHGDPQAAAVRRSLAEDAGEQPHALVADGDDVVLQLGATSRCLLRAPMVPHEVDGGLGLRFGQRGERDGRRGGFGGLAQPLAQREEARTGLHRLAFGPG